MSTQASMIDLSRLPAPQVVEALDYEEILNQLRGDLRARIAEQLAKIQAGLPLPETSPIRQLAVRTATADAQLVRMTEGLQALAASAVDHEFLDICKKLQNATEEFRNNLGADAVGKLAQGVETVISSLSSLETLITEATATDSEVDDELSKNCKDLITEVDAFRERLCGDKRNFVKQETQGSEALVSSAKVDQETLLQSLEEVSAALELESEPLSKVLEVCAYRELLLRQRINDATRAVMLPYARGADLDNLGALFNEKRAILEEGNLTDIPPKEAVMEDDARYRARLQMALEGVSTAGPRAAYIHHGMNASAQVKDISVESPMPGEVVVTVLAQEGDGAPDINLLDTVEAALNAEDVRPLTDKVSVKPAEVIHYTVAAKLTLYPGPGGEEVRAAAEVAVQQYVREHHKLGHDITVSGLHAALHQPSVQRVVLENPNAALTIKAHQAAYCIEVNVELAGREE